ncbi:helix-turn-helix domain-containing protein [Methanolobus mangrovi]|uniref:Helix-turn-helix domain-containing protein n=1 Tax=Methanolobus mangrovi TaxID=3072977 RepID=A0AA51UIK4_9EURY|nr:helix-turn-helix domain-containing protein [Methanolobus mangrovi]WMW22792.1 helix-turn-helix domain-containing protein [Methanolobus mangrovi]
MATYNKTVNENEQRCCCPVEATLSVIGGKWKPLILWHLKENTMRYNSLQQVLPGISPRMLTKQLRELENDGIVNREMYPEIPPRVEYSLTDFGRTIIPVLEALAQWGIKYTDQKGSSK